MFVTIPSTDFEEKIRMEGAVQTIRDVLMPEICQFKRAKSRMIGGTRWRGEMWRKLKKPCPFWDDLCATNLWPDIIFLGRLAIITSEQSLNLSTASQTDLQALFRLFPHIMDVVKAVETYITKLVSVPSAMKVLLLDTHTVCSEPFLTY
jgi:hypothetical protein